MGELVLLNETVSITISAIAEHYLRVADRYLRPKTGAGMTGGLLGCDAGSICSVDEAVGTYRKEADIGVACQSGRVFPLTEGMTGVVVARLIRYVAAVHVVIAGEPYRGAAERSWPAPTRSLMSCSKPSSPTCLSGPATMWR